MNEDLGLSTAEVAKLVGVHRDTLLRWLRGGQIPEPSRDRRGWRRFTKAEAHSIVAFATSAAGASPKPSLSATALQRLQDIDWDFRGAKTGYLTHGLHPYPAKYIPQIPNALIQSLSVPGETVGDFFCGSGTTIVESLLLKRNAVGIDANPLAVLITKAKTTALNHTQLAAIDDLSARAESASQSLSVYEKDSLFERPYFKSAGARPDDAEIGLWFDDFVVEELAEAKLWCQQLGDQATKNLALVSLSSIIVTVSRQDSDTRYVRREKSIRPGDTLRRFAKALREASRVVAELSDVCEPRFRSTILAANVLDQPEVPLLDLVVCSPPYPNAYSYHLYHRTRMLWLDMDQPTFKRAEIGSHRKYSAKGTNAANAGTFKRELSVVFEWLRKNLRRDRYACFVIGNSIVAGVLINNARLLVESAAEHGFSHEATIKRTIHAHKKAFNPTIGKIKTETIEILINKDGTSR